MNRVQLIKAKSIIEDEIGQYEDELSYLRAAKKNLETLIDKEQLQPVPKPPTDEPIKEPLNETT